MTFKATTLLSLLLLISGCSTAPIAPGCTQLGRGGQFCLLAPAALPAVSASHLVTLVRIGRQDTFMGLLRIDAHALRLAGFSLFGTNLFTIEYDGHAISSEPKHGDWHPELLVAMLELVVADPAMLQPRLHKLTLTLSTRGNTQVRELFEHGRLVARIEETGTPLSQARIRIEIPPARITLQMTPIAASMAPP
ncbi:MAG: DUF3261 domain-containing protein [Gammaproteobacteria bacterium]